MTSPRPLPPNLTIRQLEVFLVASRTLSFTEAARRLAVSQPSLSASMTKMERTIGVALFKRVGRRVALTEEGLRLAAAAADLVRIYHASIAGLRETGIRRRTRLRIAVPQALGTWLIPETIAAFRRVMPEYDCVVHDVDRAEQVRLLLDGSVDLIIATDAPHLVEIERETIGTFGFRVVVPIDSPLAVAAALDWQNLMEEPLVLAGNLQRRGLLQGVWQEAGYDLVPAYEVNELVTGLGMVRAGLGYVLLPELYLPSPLVEGLVAVPLKSAALTRPLEVLHRRAASSGAAGARLVDCLRGVLAEHGLGHAPAATGRRGGRFKPA